MAALPAGDSTCGDVFDGLLERYRDAFIAAGDGVRSRVDDPVGGHLHALVSTSVLTGGAAAAFEQARRSYLAADPQPLAVDFHDVRFGYWGSAADLDRVAQNPMRYDDLKTDKLDDMKALYDLDEPTSAFSQSIAQSDGVWCTDWDSYATGDIAGVSEDAYHAPFQTRDPFFTDASRPYPNLSSDLGIRGCSFLAPPATAAR